LILVTVYWTQKAHGKAPLYDDWYTAFGGWKVTFHTVMIGTTLVLS